MRWWRRVRYARAEHAPPVSPPIVGQSLNREHAAVIKAADTFFVASAHPQHGVDASRRGGSAGFFDLVDDRTLRIPEYVGNSMFHTPGNFAVNPRAALVFLNLAENTLLQMTGSTCSGSP